MHKEGRAKFSTRPPLSTLRWLAVGSAGVETVDMTLLLKVQPPPPSPNAHAHRLRPFLRPFFDVCGSSIKQRCRID